MDSSFLNLQNLIEGFRISCQTEGKSPKTVKWYTTFLEKFRVFLERKGLPDRVDQLDKVHVRQFILYLQQEARTPRTNRYLSGATVQGYVRRPTPEAILTMNQEMVSLLKFNHRSDSIMSVTITNRKKENTKGIRLSSMHMPIYRLSNILSLFGKNIQSCITICLAHVCPYMTWMQDFVLWISFPRLPRS